MSLGGFSKDKLVFDPTAALDSDNIGSYVRSGSSGAQITNHATQKPSSGSFSFVDADVTPASDTITEASHGFQTGDKAQLTSTGTLPAGLALATDYFVIRVDANTIKLASSIANAEAGIAVDITAAAGGGTHTLTGQEQEVRSLDVWLSNPSIVVTATDLDIRDLTQADEVTVFQGTDPWIIGDGGGSISIDDNGGSITVDATDLDIRDLDHSQDNVAIAQGGNTMVVNADGSINVNADISVVNGHEKAEDAAHVSGDIGSYVLAVRQDTLATSTSADGDYASLKVDALGRLYVAAQVAGDVADDDVDSGNPIKIGFHAYAGPLSAVSAAGDRVNGASDLYRRLYVNNGSNIAIEDTQVNVTDAAATALPTTSLAGRRTIMIQNLSSKEVYIGKTGVTSANGFVLGARATLSLDLGPDIVVYARGSQATAQDLRILELA
jgi:hypothetical protein